MLDKMEERGAKPFHHWKVCLFLFKNLFPTTSQILENCFYNFFSNCHKSLWTIIKCFLGFVTLSNTRKNGPKIFVIVKTASFEMFVSIDLLVSKEWSYHLHNKCQKTPWTPENNSLPFVMLDKTKKNGAKIFSSLESLPFFVQNFLFSTISQILEKCFYKVFSNCHNSLWTLIKCSLSFVTLCNTRKDGPKTFNIVKTVFLKRLFLSTSYSPKKWSSP